MVSLGVVYLHAISLVAVVVAESSDVKRPAAAPKRQHRGRLEGMIKTRKAEKETRKAERETRKAEGDTNAVAFSRRLRSRRVHLKRRQRGRSDRNDHLCLVPHWRSVGSAPRAASSAAPPPTWSGRPAGARLEKDPRSPMSRRASRIEQRSAWDSSTVVGLGTLPPGVDGDRAHQLLRRLRGDLQRESSACSERGRPCSRRRKQPFRAFQSLSEATWGREGKRSACCSEKREMRCVLEHRKAACLSESGRTSSGSSATASWNDPRSRMSHVAHRHESTKKQKRNKIIRRGSWVVRPPPRPRTPRPPTRPPNWPQPEVIRAIYPRSEVIGPSIHNPR